MFKQSLAALTTALLLAGATAPAQAQAAKTIKYTHFQPGREDQPKHAAALAFKKHVEEKSNGSLKVQIFPAGQLGNATTVMEGLRFGTVDLGVVHDGGISGTYKAFDIFALPYLFKNQKVAWSVLDGPFGKEFAEGMRKETGIRLMAYADNGIRHFTNSKKPITKPDDLKGMKIRVQPSPVFIELVKGLGASPSAIDWAELPAALAQGTVDGQENGVTNIIAGSLFQSQKYVTLDGHVYSLHAYLMSDSFYQGLSVDQKKIVDEGVEIAKQIHRKLTSDQDLAAGKILAEKGMTVTELSPEQVDAFRKIAQPAVRAHLEKESGKEIVGKLIDAANQAEKSM
ncbi:MAG: TRAP-type transport system periplasmic protein [Variibacter sp.]|nr:TRAP-type transport system periplasmic protein [Variibacter sp.]